ncbi:MAG: ATP-binding cassette domain-containing protein [Goleter apudmare HA4340-LM2]|jgi:ABC-type multidrug transport system fused ATPase/permease subunit|nr:ATP-binding cassette domain-containing protein [Goleter apudmare HA4340-LM2]
MLQFASKLLYLTKGHHKMLVVMVFVFIIVSFLEVIGTAMIGPFIAVATTPDLIKNNYWLYLIYSQLNFSSEQYFLIFLAIIVLIAYYLKSFLSFEAQKSVFQFGFTLKGNLSHKLLKAYLEAPYSFHLRINSASIIQNITNTTDNVCLGVVMPLLTAISNFAIVLALTLLLIKASAIALFMIVLLLPVVFGLVKSLKSRLAFWSKEGWGSEEEMIRIVHHALGSLKETRVIGCEYYFDHQMEQQTKRFAENISLNRSYGNLPRFVIEAFMITFLVIFTLLYINLNRGQGQNLSAILGIFALASIRLLPAVSNLVGAINVFRSNTFGVDKLFFDFQEIEKLKNLPTASINHLPKNLSLGSDALPFSLKKQIVLSQVTFQYPDTSRKSLDEISLTIPKGESIGVIGKSGAGKTTLVDVLLGLFIPQCGDIKVDGVSVYSNLRSWQNMLGYVPQSIFLIDDTLERNIAFGVPDHLIDQNRLRKAVEMAQLSEVVEQLPDGVKTVVGERGVLLSGGQRQRVGIARVLYYEREILVFDEATAALDTETEHLITEATKALAGTKTIIIIAHRLSTIEHCNRIYQLDQGRIVKSGSYQEVILDKNK